MYLLKSSVGTSLVPMHLIAGSEKALYPEPAPPLQRFTTITMNPFFAVVRWLCNTPPTPPKVSAWHVRIDRLLAYRSQHAPAVLCQAVGPRWMWGGAKPVVASLGVVVLDLMSGLPFSFRSFNRSGVRLKGASTVYIYWFWLSHVCIWKKRHLVGFVS